MPPLAAGAGGRSKSALALLFYLTNIFSVDAKFFRVKPSSSLSTGTQQPTHGPGDFLPRGRNARTGRIGRHAGDCT